MVLWTNGQTGSHPSLILKFAGGVACPDMNHSYVHLVSSLARRFLKDGGHSDLSHMLGSLGFSFCR